MGLKFMELKGLKCPQPTLRMTIEVRTRISQGDILEVVADCPTFENDLKNWCKRMGKVLLWVREEGNGAKGTPLPISLMALAWGCPFAGRSWSITAAGYGWRAPSERAVFSFIPFP